jgi:Imidazoleglycerol-phosphate synthase
MLKRRIIPLLLWLDGRVVKTVRFGSPRVVGRLESLAAVYSDQDADELIILDISPRQDAEPSPVYRELERVIERVRCPVAFGGNVQTMTEVDRLFQLGVEKICLPSHHLIDDLVAQVGQKFGSQAVTVSVDILEKENAPQVVTNRGARPTEQDLFQILEMCRERGAGELLVQDVKKDGTGSGLNLRVLTDIRNHIEIPLIGAGGVGN